MVREEVRRWVAYADILAHKCSPLSACGQMYKEVAISRLLSPSYPYLSKLNEELIYGKTRSRLSVNEGANEFILDGNCLEFTISTSTDK